MHDLSHKPIIMITAENKPGVLGRILALCRRRQFNIDGITAGKTHHSGLSHITIVFDEDIASIDKVIRQIDKLIDVINIQKVDIKQVVDRELVLLILKNQSIADRIMNDKMHAAQIRQLNTLDDHPVLEVVANGAEVEHIIGNLDMNKEVIQMVRSGLVAMKYGSD